MTPSRTLMAAAGAAALVTLGACVAPAPGGGVIVTPPVTPIVYDPSGRWCFTDNRDRPREHVIQAYTDGMVVSAANRPEIRREFDRVSSGRYEEINGDAVYIFYANGTAVFSRDGTQANSFDVTRCT